MNRIRCVAALLSLAAGLFALPSHAQLLDRYTPAGIPGYPDWFADTVQTHDTPGYEPLTVRLGSFVLDPSLAVSLAADTNPQNAPHGATDGLAETNAALHLGSDWSRNELDAAFNVDDVRYFTQTNQSYTSWNAAAGGRLDIGEDALTAAYSHANSVSLPTEVGSFSAASPVGTVIDDGRLDYQIRSGAVGLTPGLEVSNFTYSGGGLAAAQARADDRAEYTARLAAAYEISGVTSLVTAVQGTASQFPHPQPDGLNTNSTAFSALFGIDYRPSGVLRGRALVGYQQLDYTNARLPGASAPAAELDLLWTPSALTTLNGRVSQSLENSPGTLTGDYVYTDVHAGIAHEYSRNLVLEAGADYQAADAVAVNSRQLAYSATLGARWRFNRGLTLALQYQAEALESSGTVSGHETRQVITFGVTLRPGAFD